MRFSIRTLFVFTTAVAVTVASLTYANPIIGDLYYTLRLLSIAFSTLAAIYRRGPQRAYWIGFVVLFAGYFCHTVWPSEVRGTWSVMQQFAQGNTATPGMSTSRLLSSGFELLHGVPSLGKPFIAPRTRVNAVTEKHVNFMTIGHTAFAFLIGVIGGAIARRFALQSVKVNEEQTERVTVPPPAENSTQN